MRASNCAENPPRARLDLRPGSAEDLIRLQQDLSRLTPAQWRPPDGHLSIAGCFAAFPRGLPGPGKLGDSATAAAVVVRSGRLIDSLVVTGAAGAAYQPGLLFIREGALLESAVRGLGEPYDVLMVNGTGRDHPRRAGLAVHLGAILDCPSIGVTHRPLCAEGSWPAEERGSTDHLTLSGALVGYWVRTKASTRPLAAHGGWRTSAETAVDCSCHRAAGPNS